MHIENELVEYVTPGEQEYDKMIEEYEEEVLVQEEFPESPVTNIADTVPAQDKSRCITRIFDNHDIYDRRVRGWVERWHSREEEVAAGEEESR
jgi:hypothetical protein